MGSKKKKKPKFYVVWEGHEPGIYESWEDCKAQVTNFRGAKYKSFPTREEAEDAYFSGPKEFMSKGRPKKSLEKPNPEPASIAVDAASSGNPGIMEYRGVWADNGDELFRMGPFEEGTANVGEFLALVHGLAFLHKHNMEQTSIYSDSKIAIGWVQRKKCNTKLKRSRKNEKLFELISRAEKWLKTHEFQNRIIKWPTKVWGEIPADFGRK
ncbi:MAG: ribonuclease H [Saprospirales bacterium]|nr:MAG: ribonuclease H [Saprospirales bacterium]